MRLVGVNIPDNKRVEIALTYIFGIGKTVSQKALKSAKIDPDKRAISTLLLSGIFTPTNLIPIMFKNEC